MRSSCPTLGLVKIFVFHQIFLYNQQVSVYSSGFNRILEAAIEWYNLEESEEEKEKVREIILSIFFHQRHFSSCNEKTDAVREALLNAYMILRDIYGEVQ